VPSRVQSGASVKESVPSRTAFSLPAAGYGDWGTNAALWFGRRLGRLRLVELAELAGGIDYSAAGAAVSRFARRLIEGELSKFEIWPHNQL
jgi:hypothetical protein